MVQIPFPKGYKPKKRHNKQKSKAKKDKGNFVSPSLNKKELEKLFSSHRNRKETPAEKHFNNIVWGDVKSPTKFDKYIVTGKNVKVEVYERTLTAQLAKASTNICRQARRWYEEEIVDDIAEWYKRWDQHPFTSRLAAIEKPYKDADYILTYMNMTTLRDNLKDGYKEMLRVANQCDRERIDYRGDLPTAPIREFKAAAAEFYEVVNAVCIKSNAEFDKLTRLTSSGEAREIEKGNIWKFNFLGETVSVDGKLKGLKLLEVLLTNPNKDYNPLELLTEAGLESQGTTASELIYEQKDRESIDKNIRDLEITYENTQDPAKKAEIKEQIDDAKEIMSNATNIFGRSRNISDKYRIRVDSLIKKVLEKMSPRNSKLHNHFNAFLKSGMVNSYKPDKKIVWFVK